MKGILLLFVEPYVAGARDSEKYMNPDLTKVSVTVNDSPNGVYNNGIGANDVWEEASRFFVKAKHKTQDMNLAKVYTGNRFELLIDLRSMSDHSMHGNDTRSVNTKDGVLLEIEQDGSGSENVSCHVFVISESQMNIQGQQLDFVQYS